MVSQLLTEGAHHGNAATAVALVCRQLWQARLVIEARATVLNTKGELASATDRRMAQNNIDPAVCECCQTLGSRGVLGNEALRMMFQA